jgi:hypothetical protein
MEAAPRDSLYIWLNQTSLDYARELATIVGRTDLIIIPLEAVMADNFRVATGQSLTIDHSVMKLCKVEEKLKLELLVTITK